MAWLQKYASDPQVASALLQVPAGLTDLSEAEQAALKVKVESHTPPHILQARKATADALAQADKGWARAQDLIAERAGLVKGVDGIWRDPDAEAAKLAKSAAA